MHFPNKLILLIYALCSIWIDFGGVGGGTLYIPWLFVHSFFLYECEYLQRGLLVWLYDEIIRTGSTREDTIFNISKGFI